MSAPATVAEKPTGTPTITIAERPGWDLPGWSMLGAGLVLFLGGIAAFVVGLIFTIVVAMVVGVVLFVASLPVLAGLTLVQPNQARVLQLLGSSYSGTLRTPGLRWTNPLTYRKAISTRIRNHETAQSTGSYPYDAEDRMSLRENADEITGAMSEEVHARVRAAGVEVIETRINRLAYAPEIAQAMLRRQQAGAVIAARRQIVEGAVGMVDMALAKLEEKHVVELDEERKATMVSNLLVVLCSDRDTQPVVNAGSLYQ
ncbi:SPFH domain-containing protein [Rhodococcus sovatensis]|uniref:SPFH domain-containing protein n=1 Tax=Rhodococcus sovatensis TaxID=1805840 RepID=A0ABZ2PPW1_9NOCA